MPVTAEKLENLKVGDRVYLKSYEEAKQDVHLSEATWNQFWGKPLKVFELYTYTPIQPIH